jgi:hypothetical protein
LDTDQRRNPLSTNTVSEISGHNSTPVHIHRPRPALVIIRSDPYYGTKSAPEFFQHVRPLRRDTDKKSPQGFRNFVLH